MTSRAPVTLPAAVRQAIVRHARASAPEECCGLLLGTGRRIRFALPMRNVAARPRARYRIDDKDHLGVRRWVRRVEPPLSIVGVYHSHPAGRARPSARDVAEAHYPDWMWIIVGRGGAEVAAFAIRSGRVTRLPLE